MNLLFCFTLRFFFFYLKVHFRVCSVTSRKHAPCFYNTAPWRSRRHDKNLFDTFPFGHELNLQHMNIVIFYILWNPATVFSILSFHILKLTIMVYWRLQIHLWVFFRHAVFWVFFFINLYSVFLNPEFFWSSVLSNFFLSKLCPVTQKTLKFHTQKTIKLF